jgi:hypothetical protein
VNNAMIPVVLVFLLMTQGCASSGWVMDEVSLIGRYDTARDSSFVDSGRYRNSGGEVTFTWRKHD